MNNKPQTKPQKQYKTYNIDNTNFTVKFNTDFTREENKLKINYKMFRDKELIFSGNDLLIPGIDRIIIKVLNIFLDFILYSTDENFITFKNDDEYNNLEYYQLLLTEKLENKG